MTASTSAWPTRRARAGGHVAGEPPGARTPPWLASALRSAAWGSVVLLAVVLVAVEGRRGFMPLDESIVFDAGWRMLNGQVPLRDFVAPNGFVPGALQAVVFAVLGVSWTAYLAHAALLNAVFGVLVMALLRRLGLPTTAAAVYAAASVVVFAPPYGSPSIEQPSFLFAFLAVVLAIVAVTGGTGGRRRMAAAAVPAVMLLAVLSKQIPALLVVPLVGVVLAWAPDRWRMLRWLAGGALASVLVVGGALWLLGVPPSRAVLHVWTLPRAVGAERLAATPSPLWGVLVPPWDVMAPAISMVGASMLAVASVPAAWTVRRAEGSLAAGLVALGMLAAAALLAVFARPPSPPYVTGLQTAPPRASLLGALAGYAVVLATGWVLAWRALPHERGQAASDGSSLPAPLLVLLPVALVVVSSAFVVLTDNQIENGAAYVFVALGCLDAAVRRLSRWGGTTGRSAVPSAALLLALALPAVAVLDAVHFHLSVNRTRIVHDFVFDPEQASSDGLPAGLDLAFDGPVAYSAAELGAVVAAVADAPGEVLVFGDTTILAALAGKSSLAPVLWWHPDLVIPPIGSAEHQSFDERLAAVLADRRVTRVVVEQAANPWLTSDDVAADGSWELNTTWTGARLLDFPRGLRVVETRRCGIEELGAFTVIHLCEPGVALPLPPSRLDHPA